MDGLIFFYLLLIPIIFGGMSAFILYIGLRGLIKKRPFIIPSRILAIFITLCFTPMLFSSIMRIAGADEYSLIWLVNPAIFILLVVVLWFQTRGYIINGISSDSFKEAISAVLKNKNINYQEEFSSIKLTDSSAQIQISAQDWMGIGQMRMKSSKDNQLLKEIAEGLEKYFKEAQVPPKNISFIFNTILGILMLVATFGLGSILKKDMPKDGLQKCYYDTKELRCEQKYSRMERNGISKYYFRSGALHSEKLYDHGDLEGISKEYYESGELRYETPYKNDKVDGVVKEYSKDGSIISERMFKNGEEVK